MKLIIALLLIFNFSLYACELGEQEKQKILKQAAQDKLKEFPRFQRFKLTNLTKEKSGGYKALLQLKEMRCKELQFQMIMGSDCQVEVSLNSIQGCSR